MRSGGCRWRGTKQRSIQVADAYLRTGAFLKLPAQAQTRCVVGANLTLPLDIAPPLCRSIKNVVGRLNEASRFKFAQEIAGGDEAHAFIDNDLPSG